MQVNEYEVLVGDEWVCKDGKKVIISEIMDNVTWCILCDGISFNKNGYYSTSEEPGPYDLDYPSKVLVDEKPTECNECLPTICDEYIEEPTVREECILDDNIDASRYTLPKGYNIVGINTTPFIKYDKGKPSFDLVDPFFEEDIAKVLSMGAAKYEPNNWQLNEDINRYIGALQRHLNDIKKGIYKDKESKLQHTAHIACNAMFIHWMIRNGKVNK